VQLFLLKQVNSLALRLLPWLLLVCGLCASHGAHAGTTYRYGGGDVRFCTFTLADKTYRCTSLPFVEWNDGMAIDSGYTVNFTPDVTFGWDNGLAMSGSARLTSNGNLHIGNIAPTGIAISGGSLHAGGKFTIGNVNQTITANVTAGSMQLGSGSKLEITGSVVASGAVNIAANAVINGPVTGGDIITDTSVRLNGNVDAKNGRVVLNHDTTVKGTVNARVVHLLATQVVVTGAVKATESLTLASGVTVDGNVDTGVLTLETSGAIVKGTAIVNRADLYDRGRVTGLIQCRAGATVNDCSCVNNQSTYPFNSDLGPKCGAVTPPPASPLHHFLISHDGSGSVCAAENVTVTACADATCSSNYTNGATFRLQPGNLEFTTGGTGSVKGSVARSTVGSEALRLIASGNTPVSCYNSATQSTSCDMAFAGAGFQIEVPSSRAGESIIATIKAMEKNPNNDSCVATFKNEQKNIEYSCSYLRPGSGTESLALGAASAATLACTPGTTRTLATRFDANGIAKVTLNYEDAGELRLKAKSGEIEGDRSFAVAPYKFGVTFPATTLRAGDDFAVTVTALSKSGKTTPNFDKDLLPAETTSTRLSVACVQPVGAGAGELTADTVEFQKGQAKPTPSWNEVGKMDLAAVTKNTFLDSGMKTEGSSAGVDPCASVGPFIPKYFLVEQVNPPRQPLDFFYAGEPIPVRVSAMNAKGAVTTNFAHTLASEPVTLLAFDKEGKNANPNGGVLSETAIGADKFTKGVALANPVYAAPAAAAPAKRVALTPGVLRLRAQNAANSVTSSASDTHEKAVPTIRSGRLRIATLFGRTGSTLKLPVTAEYWSGNSWLLNDKDNVSVIPATAMAQSAFAHANSNGIKPKTQVFPALTLSGGKAELPVQGDTAGWIDIAFNLGAGTLADQSCLAAHPPTQGAARPWLQAFGDCKDPSGRATFGIHAPESRRIIHVREVFN